MQALPLRTRADLTVLNKVGAARRLLREIPVEQLRRGDVRDLENGFGLRPVSGAHTILHVLLTKRMPEEREASLIAILE